VRRTRYVREQRPVFGRFHSVLLCREHLTGPFRGGLQYFERSANISGPSRDATKFSDHNYTGGTWPSRLGCFAGDENCADRAAHGERAGVALRRDRANCLLSHG
jgi:hypothetical protein